LAALFDERSQLLAYNIMFRPEYTGACPGCSNLADHLDAGVVHLVTLFCISRPPLEKLQAYKRRMGWKFPWVSSYGRPDWLQGWAESVGTNLEAGLAEGPGWMAFALEDGVVYHTSSRLAPDRDFVVPYYHQRLDRTPKRQVDEFRAWRHDEYAAKA
jgi:predicted dithiol-disulfide oxidoreductase (DUF899 family)